ncbi:hypothetical protein [Nocardioides mesophilus]|uniref:Uncharacterized protein n=1 Tax=Nocardioides mesophilus TaxID=433659 RepID=A0A7G9RDH5_9ACTN|nr:hypothetical protein [Nocardioides mesophilus]QNN53650.1 hypothetical protein H9L09_04300 [Nocardioides mesophilus]
MRRRIVTIAAASAGTVLLATGPALAHECYIASRSWQGNLMSGTHSQAWYQVDLNEEFANDPSLTEADAQCLLTQRTANGVPLVFTIHVKGAVGQDGVLADNNPNSWLMADGKGVDHFFDVYGEALGASFAACGLEFQP